MLRNQEEEDEDIEALMQSIEKDGLINLCIRDTKKIFVIFYWLGEEGLTPSNS